MNPIPFAISSTHAGFGRCDGMIAFEKGAVQFELQSKLAGVIKTEIKTFTIPVAEVASIELRGRWLKPSIQLQLKSLQAAQSFPRSEGSEVILELRRQDKLEARTLVDAIKMALIDHSLDALLAEEERETSPQPEKA